MSLVPQTSTPPSGVQIVTLAAACAWIATYTAYAIAFREENREPWLMAASLALALTVDAVALAPLFKREDPYLGRAMALALAVAAVVVAAAVLPFLTPHGLSGYANWPVGAMCVLIAALTLRRRGGAAALVVVGLTAVNVLCVWYASRQDPSIIGAPGSMFIGVLPFTWWLGALTVRSMLDRSGQMAEEYRRRHVDFAAEALVSRAVHHSDDQRRSELRTRVLPLLEDLAQGSGPVDEGSRAEATRIAASLRDDLKARSLLDGSLRELVASARGRGVWVSLSCDIRSTSDSGDDLLPLARAALSGILPALGGDASVTCRVTSSPSAVVLVVNGVAAEKVVEVAGSIRAAAAQVIGASVAVDSLERELVAHLALDGARTDS